MTIEYCPLDGNSLENCPACGASISGDDSAKGICQALHPKQLDDWLQIILERFVNEHNKT